MGLQETEVILTYNNIMHPTKLPAAVKSEYGLKGRLAGDE